LTEDNDLTIFKALIKQDIENRMALVARKMAAERRSEKLSEEIERRRRVDAAKRLEEIKLQRLEEKRRELEDERQKRELEKEVNEALKAYAFERTTLWSKLEKDSADLLAMAYSDPKTSALLIAIARVRAHDVWSPNQAVEAFKKNALYELKMRHAEKLSLRARNQFFYLTLLL
jgi:hypothetical protein